MKKFFNIFSAIMFCTIFAGTVLGHSTTVVISQVYGGGNNTGATFQRDYIELKNVSNAPQSLNGLSVMYGSGTGQFGSSAANVLALNNVVLLPGQYYLVLGGGGTVNGAAITNFDQASAIANLNLSGTNGKVALVTSTFAANSCGATATPCTLSNLSPSAIGVIDLIAYGTSNNAEGGAALAALTNTTAGMRASSGCSDTDRNIADFSAAAATVPNYSGTTAAPCNILDITTTNIMPNGSVGAGYSNSLVASGGTGPYTFAVSGGAVPTGLTLNNDGTWSGTASMAGIYNFDVTATDSTLFAPLAREFRLLNNNTTTESFQITIFTPTASTANVQGRVITASGRGLSRSSISIQNTQSGEIRYARTNQLGYFTIPDLQVGDFYILQVERKGYQFEQNSFQLLENLEGFVITGNPIAF